MKRFLFSRLESVKKNEEFRRIYKTGKKFHKGGITLYLRENGLPYSRLGVSVSTRSGNSVIRHRFVRLVKEVFRLHRQELKSGFDFITVCGKTLSLKNSSLLNYFCMEKLLLALFLNAGVLCTHSEFKKSN